MGAGGYKVSFKNKIESFFLLFGSVEIIVFHNVLGGFAPATAALQRGSDDPLFVFLHHT
jgi:hypothetical protein